MAYVRENSGIKKAGEGKKDDTNNESKGKKNKFCWFGSKRFRSKLDFDHHQEGTPPMYRKYRRKDCLLKHSNDCLNKKKCSDDSCISRHYIQAEVEANLLNEDLRRGSMSRNVVSSRSVC